MKGVAGFLPSAARRILTASAGRNSPSRSEQRSSRCAPAASDDAAGKIDGVAALQGLAVELEPGRT